MEPQVANSIDDIEARIQEEESIIKDYQCPVCMNLMVAPKNEPRIWTGCGHEFCSQCCRSLTACALCRHARDAVCPTVPAFRTRRKIETFKVKCKHQDYGCTEVCAISEISKHEEQCSLAPSTCKHCSKLVPKSDIGLHQAVCGEMITKCPGSAYGCQVELPVKELPVHLKKCRKELKHNVSSMASCRFFVTGHCKRGKSRCRFRHSYTATCVPSISVKRAG